MSKKSKAELQKIPNQKTINALLEQVNHPGSETLNFLKDIVDKYPSYGLGWKALAFFCEQSGYITLAMSAYQSAITFLTNDHEIHFNLGNLYLDKFEFESALDSYTLAIQINPDFYPTYFNIVTALINLDRIDEAIQILDNASLSVNQDKTFNNKISELYYLIGLKFSETDRLNLAESCFIKTLELKSDFNDANIELAKVYYKNKNFDQAFIYADKVLLLDPNNELAAHIKEKKLLLSKNFQEVVEYFSKKLNESPNDANLYSQYGEALRLHSRLLGAKEQLNAAVRLNPKSVEALNSLGLLNDTMGLHAEAQDAYEKALTHSPDNYGVLGNLGVSLTSEYKLDHAEAALKKALLICPENPKLIVNLCNCLRLQGRIDEVVNILEAALLINPNSIELLDNLLYNSNYIDAFTPQDSFDIAKKFGDILESNIRLFKDKTPLNNKRFKVGLVSADFKSHPVSYFLINILPFIDLARFDLIAYTNSGGIDNITHELRTYFTDWYSVHDLNDEAASELIYGHDLNLLIDLSGHTKGNRLAIFAKRVAPVQVSWLGYFGTTGIKNMDYFLADEVGVPAKNQAFFSEKIKYLPNTRLCFSVPNLSIEITPLPALNNNFVTFGCFQSAAKLNDRSIKLFVKVLKKVTNAKLRIQNGSLSDESVISNLRDRFYLAGIDPKRLILLPGVDRNRYFLAHDDVDMILDTFPFNGGTTTCEALWMGVPTLTLAGDTLIARQGASLLLAAGLDNWVANSEDEFVDKAVSLSSNLKSLSILRHSLRTQVLSSPLFDGPLFAKNLENAFLEMWQEKTNTLNFLNPTVDCDDQFDSLESQDVIVVSATRLTEFEFWSKSALGLSLKKHQSRDKRIHTAITFENKRGLPDIYNDQITNEIGAPILAFIHDDVWIDEPDFVDKVIQGLRTFDIIGVAGNRRLVECQPAWSFLNDNFIWDTPENLTGAISHGRSAFGDISVYGDSPAPSKLLDGVFLAVHKNILLDSNVYFDSSFKFHFYDMDFCRAASKAGLSLGSYPIRLTRQSSGAFGSFEWREAYYKYLAKWDEIDLYNNKNIVEKEKSEFERSIENVIVFAKQHFKAGNFDEAKNLLDEVLLYSPGYAEAKNLMELININKNT